MDSSWCWTCCCCAACVMSSKPKLIISDGRLCFLHLPQQWNPAARVGISVKEALESIASGVDRLASLSLPAQQSTALRESLRRQRQRPRTEMFASSGAPASCLRSSLPKAGRKSVACASRGLRNPQNRICLPRGSPAARPCRPCWTSHAPSPPCKHDDAFRPLHAGLLAPCTRPASRTRALVDGLCAGVDMPPFTVCSRVTGIPLPWGPLGPVGLALSAFVIGSTWLDEASTSRDKLNAVTGAVLLCLAAAPRNAGRRYSRITVAVGFGFSRIRWGRRRAHLGRLIRYIICVEWPDEHQ